MYRSLAPIVAEGKYSLVGLWRSLAPTPRHKGEYVGRSMLGSFDMIVIIDRIMVQPS